MAKRSVRRKLSLVETMDVVDTKARQEGPTRKNWSLHDLKFIKPKTIAQSDMFEHWAQGLNVVAHGSPGTGKTFLAIYLALRELLQPNSQYEKIVVIRSTVPTRDMGFLPGSQEEKMAVYEQPYKDIFDELIHYHNTYRHMKEAGKVEFMSTSFMRGTTFRDSLVILDEAQSLNWHELNTVITRIGEGSRLIICGDIKQSDLIHRKTDQSGLPQALKVFERMTKHFATVSFTHSDIVRGPLVKSWIMACEEENL